MNKFLRLIQQLVNIIEKCLVSLLCNIINVMLELNYSFQGGMDLVRDRGR